MLDIGDFFSDRIVVVVVLPPRLLQFLKTVRETCENKKMCFLHRTGAEDLPALWPADGSVGEEGGADGEQPQAQGQGQQDSGVLREAVPRDPKAEGAAGALPEVTCWKRSALVHKVQQDFSCSVVLLCSISRSLCWCDRLIGLRFLRIVQETTGLLTEHMGLCCCGLTG